MRRSRSSEVLSFDPEIERTLQQLWRNQRVTEPNPPEPNQPELNQQPNPLEVNQPELNQPEIIPNQPQMDNRNIQPLAVAPPIPIRDRIIPIIDGLTSCIVLPPLPTNTCDIKTCIQMIQQFYQFGGNPTEDPNTHIINFLEICGTFNYNRNAEEVIRLRAFP